MKPLIRLGAIALLSLPLIACDNGISESKGTVTFVHNECATGTYGQPIGCPGGDQ